MELFNSFKQLKYQIRNMTVAAAILMITACSESSMQNQAVTNIDNIRERISINEGWHFYKYDSISLADKLIYDVRPEVFDREDNRVADSRPTEAVKIEQKQDVLKNWILPSGNEFIEDTTRRYIRPEGDPGNEFPFVQGNFDDSSWEEIDLPHDWAIRGPFLQGRNAEIGGGMGRLPVNGVAWYRKKIDIPASDMGKSVFLDVDGAMSYAMVWLNGHLVGGWPYGYNSWRLDLTPYIVPGGINQLAIRLDNPPASSRWYPGAGIYRNVWIVKTNPVHVAQWGTFVTSGKVSPESADINIKVSVDNKSGADTSVEVITRIYALDEKMNRKGKVIAETSPAVIKVNAGKSAGVSSSVTLKNPMLWGPPPTQHPYLYVAVTTLLLNGNPVDTYETQFGVRTLDFDADKGILVNGEHIQIKGVNQHHDLGSLGAAFDISAARRQLEILREMGCNAIRTAHNPPAPELLDLTDQMGFLVIDEIFDTWEQKKTPLDFHLIFPDWYEQDTRSFIRRDRNHPSVIIWSFGNEVGEQYTGEEGAALAGRLYNIVREEDPTRPSTTAMNYAKPDMALPEVPDIISLNYQGEGIRDAAAYSHLHGIHTSPLYRSFRDKFPGKLIISTESASTLSSRGTYLFPVFEGISAPVGFESGGDPQHMYVSAYDLYTSDFGASPDKVFTAQDTHPFVAGEFVWSGWDYLGEPTPYYSARSSYSGIIDLAGFKKDRYYLYQSRWCPDMKIAHILPHWTWPERAGMITPVHLFTSGDEAELFLNGKSLGRKKKEQNEYRLRWDSVQYEPGKLEAVAYKNGKVWAKDIVETAGDPAKLVAMADRKIIKADGTDLVFITVQVTDSKKRIVPRSDNIIEFYIEGPGKIIATDNGDPTDMVAFPSNSRKAFNGLALAIVRSEKNATGTIKLIIKSPGLTDAQIVINSK